MERIEEVNLRTFNQAKKYAEEVLFPMMEAYQKYMRQSDFGTENLDDAQQYSEEIREIMRFNGLKASADVIYNLITTIKSTVLLKNNKEEKEMMEKLIDTIKGIRKLFYEQKEKFFREIYRRNGTLEILDKEYFEKVKEIIMVCYVNTEVLMTKNKLLFSDSKDEYATDADIMEEIKKEYTEI